MRRFKALLIAAALAAAPASAAAGPCPPSTDHPQSMSETLEQPSRRGRLGVYVMSLTPELRKHFGAEERGVLVARVAPLSPAALAGIKPGDVLTEVRGREVDEAADVVSAISDAPKDQPLVVEIVRDRKSMELSVKLGSAPTSWLGPLAWLHELLAPQSAASQPTIST
jgi:serine protease DegQ